MNTFTNDVSAGQSAIYWLWEHWGIESIQFGRVTKILDYSTSMCIEVCSAFSMVHQQSRLCCKFLLLYSQGNVYSMFIEDLD